MTHKPLLLTLGLLSATSAFAQSSADLDEGVTITRNSGQTLPYSLTWWAKPGFFYFILQSEDLAVWTAYPYAVIGADGIEGIDFDTNTDRIFFKLHATNDTNSAPYVLDYDKDGISNGDELVGGALLDAFNAQTIVDSEPDGMPDYWEMFYFGNLSRDGLGDYDNDGIIDKLEWQGRSNPDNNDAELSALRRDYSYDSVGRLIEAKGPVKVTYTFDNEGNILSAE